MKTFGYKGITIKNCRLKDQFEEVCGFYRNISNDSLLYPYRARAGFMTPGIEMGGNYVGHNPFGQYISGFARIYAITQDTIYLEKVEALISGWAECIDVDGFFFAIKKPEIQHYYYDKMVCGLIDSYIFCDLDIALIHLKKITNWAINNLSQEKPYARPTGLNGGEWYTLSENLYRAYLATKDSIYKDFAKVWEYREFWDQIGLKEDIFKHSMNGGWYHAYSHVNSFSGLGAAYLVKKDEYYLDTLKKAYEFMIEGQLWPTGGYGPNECLMPKQQMVAMLEKTNAHFETQCGSWAALKMAKYLLQFTNDARYGDWIEKLLFNGVGASIPVEADGKVFYYSDYHLGGACKKQISPWTCCTGTRIQAVADYYDLLYFNDEDNLYVNMFVPSTVSWEKDNTEIKVSQATSFPEHNSTNFTINVKLPVKFALNIRVPGWMTGKMRININGKIVDAVANDKHWIVLHRCWKDADCITIQFPMDFKICRINKDKEFPAAIMYGPVVMAINSLDKNPSALFDFKNVENNFAPISREKLLYHLPIDDSVIIKPFYQYGKNEKYFMFLDPDYRYFRVSYSEMELSQGWTEYSHRSYVSTSTVGETIEYSFKGESMRIIGYRNDDCGKFKVLVDDDLMGIVDQYGTHMGELETWKIKDFSPGIHKMKLILIPEKNSESKGNCINIAGIEIINED